MPGGSVVTAVKSPVTAYAEAVVAGEVVVGRLVRLACERHLRDLKEGHKRGLHFDDDAARHALEFFGFLRHSKGEWAGRPFELASWQVFIVGSIFGWKRADETRRFREALEEVARKNGKTTQLAGIGLYLAFFDNEPGAEVYFAATMRDQAKIGFGEAQRMVLATPQLKAMINSLAVNLHDPRTNSKCEPLGADADNYDGLNIHGGMVDELHQHKTRKMVDVLETGAQSRRQPLTFYITTAGFDRHSICWEKHEYAVKVLEGVIDDDAFFAYIATIDDGDDWSDPACWPKANPNLGISVKLESLERQVEAAKQVPGKQNPVKRLLLNIWTEQADRWLDMTVWDECSGPLDVKTMESELTGQACYAALDLSSRIDVTALALVFPDGDGGYDLLSYFFIPSENMRQRVQRDRVPYDVWADQDLVEATEGNVVDYDAIRLRINDLGSRYNIKNIRLDRWNSTQLSTQLRGDGFDVLEMGQGFSAMSDPTKEFERLVVSRQIRHGGHPVLRWMASNVAVEQDAAGNLKPSKAKSTERIDGIAAAVMAVDGAMRHTKPAPTLPIGNQVKEDDRRPEFAGIRNNDF
jgi:phage terminase large subunit-like protein